MENFKITVDNVESPTLFRYTIITCIIYGVVVLLSIIGTICAAAGWILSFIIGLLGLLMVILITVIMIKAKGGLNEKSWQICLAFSIVALVLAISTSISSWWWYGSIFCPIAIAIFVYLCYYIYNRDISSSGSSSSDSSSTTTTTTTTTEVVVKVED